jgi:phosphopantetheinyl transferase
LIQKKSNINSINVLALSASASAAALQSIQEKIAFANRQVLFSQRSEERIPAYWLLFRILKKMGLSPEKLEIGHNSAGKPFIKNQNNLHITISHTKNGAAVAVAPFPIGIDIEFVRRQRAHLAIARRFFTKEEAAFLEESPVELAKQFSVLWTMKESAGKLMGEGLLPTLKINLAPIIQASVPQKNIYKAEGLQWQINRDLNGFCVAVCIPEKVCFPGVDTFFSLNETVDDADEIKEKNE